MDAVLTCMVSERIGPGEMNQKLTQIVRETFAVDGAAAFRSPAIAIGYALAALDLPKGSGVVISALAPSWHYRALKQLGYEPVVVDVDPDTALMTRASADDGIARGGRLILAHETLGFLPNLPDLAATGVPIVEDVSQSAGAACYERQAGQFGVFSIIGLEERDLLTGGGGALLVAPSRRESIVLKKLVDEAPATDILPDINAALAFVQVKELGRNAAVRQEMSSMYTRSLMQGRHKTFVQRDEGANAVYSFPVVLSSGLKDVRQYVGRKEIELELAFEDSVVAFLGEGFEGCPNARSLSMRCVLFPLYPRLGTGNAAKIAKVLATLP